MFTSGTTSLPKGVLLTYGDFSAYVTANVELADGTPRGAALLCAPLYHIAGATNMMTTLWTGRRLVIMAQFEARAWLDLVERERITHAFVVPTMMKHLLDQPDLEQRDLGSLEVLAYGGAPMPFPVIRRAIERLPKTVGFVNAFGQTETTSTLTVLGPEDHRLDGTPADVERTLRRLRSIGRPLPDVEVRIVGEEGEDLATDQVGEIHVRTPRAMKGYAGAGDSPFTADGWLPTRDLGWVDADGYLYVAGRKDDMIIRGGENIAPAEVEAVLGAHPAVDEVAVVGLPDVEWGQRVGAFVVLREGARGDGGRAGRLLPATARQLQEARGHPVSRRAAEEPDGQGAAPRAAGAGRRRVSGRVPRGPAVEVAVEHGIAWLTLARPARRNLLDAEMMGALADASQAVEHDESVRVAVLSGPATTSAPAFHAESPGHRPCGQTAWQLWPA